MYATRRLAGGGSLRIQAVRAHVRARAFYYPISREAALQGRRPDCPAANGRTWTVPHPMCGI